MNTECVIKIVFNIKKKYKKKENKTKKLNEIFHTNSKGKIENCE